MSDIDALRTFAKRVLEPWPDSAVDGFELQDAAIVAGLLRMKDPKPVEPCGESCRCSDYYGYDEFEQGVECYERTPRLNGSPKRIQDGEEDNRRLRAWLEHIVGGDSPCTDESQLRQWAYEAIVLQRPAP